MTNVHSNATDALLAGVQAELRGRRNRAANQLGTKKAQVACWTHHAAYSWRLGNRSGWEAMLIQRAMASSQPVDHYGSDPGADWRTKAEHLGWKHPNRQQIIAALRKKTALAVA